MLTRCFCRGNKDPNRLKQIFAQPEHCFSLFDYPIIPLYLAIRCAADFFATILYKRLFPPNLHCDIGISRSKGRQQFVRRNTCRKQTPKSRLTKKRSSEMNAAPQTGGEKTTRSQNTTEQLQKEIPKDPKKVNYH